MGKKSKFGKKENVCYVAYTPSYLFGEDNFFNHSITVNSTNKPNNEAMEDCLLSTRGDEEYQKKIFEYFAFFKMKDLMKREKNIKFVFNTRPDELLDIAVKSEHELGAELACLNDPEIVKFISNKKHFREYVSDKVPCLSYVNYNGKNIDFKQCCEELDAKKLVVQGIVGGGGKNTFFVNSPQELKEIDLEADSEYTISKYVEENTPINVHFIVGDNNSLILPTLAQIIDVNTNTGSSVGADFIYPQKFTKEVKEKIASASRNLTQKLGQLGYRGVGGADFILTPDGDIYFIEVNARLQGSTFVINRELNKMGTSVGELNYMAFAEETLPKKFENIAVNECYVKDHAIEYLDDYTEIMTFRGGTNNNDSVRYLFDRSILKEGPFLYADDSKLIEKTQSVGMSYAFRNIDFKGICLDSAAAPEMA